MPLRIVPVLVYAVVVLLLAGGPRQVWSQDRGAPRFGPTAQEDSLEVGAADAGRLWSVAAPPFDRLEERYGIQADTAWATHLRRSIVRLPGCTASLVSPQGLAVTTARCVRRPLADGRTDEPVLAPESSQERRIPGLHADHLLAASDVTEEVRTAKRDGNQSLEEAVETVRERLQAEVKTGRRVEIGSAGGGARHTAYTYRRYDDVRLVFLPARAVSAFGGTTAAFSYPRSTLNVALVRIYSAEGASLRPIHYFDPFSQPIRPGEPVLSVGHSTETHRNKSAEQLVFRRDVSLPSQEARLRTWTQVTQAYLDTVATASPRWAEALDGGRRALKQVRARLQALQNEYVMARLQKRDAQLRDAVRDDPALARRFAGILDSLSALQEAKRDRASAYRAFGSLTTGPYGSSTLRRAILVHRASDADLRGPDSLWQQVSQVPVQPAPVDAALLTTQLEAFRDYLAPDTVGVRALMNGSTPAERARFVVERSVLSQAEPSGSAQTQDSPVPDDDPALAVVDAVASHYRSFGEEWNRLMRTERKLTQRLARARMEVSSSPHLPARAGTPRLSGGRLLGYPYNGTAAPPFTTLYGLYSRSSSFGGRAVWSLPDEWTPMPDGLDRSAALNLAVSTDAAAGVDGAPLLNQYLEIIGLAVGTNVQGTAGPYLFLPGRMRTVAVDLRGLRQALTHVYEADAITEELFGNRGEADP